MARASSELSERASRRAPQRASFLYIVVLRQPRLVGRSRFQYYLDCDRTFDLFDCIEAYSCEAPLPLSQLTPEPRLRPVELYPSCREVKDPPVNPLRSVPRDPLHIYHQMFDKIFFLLYFVFNSSIQISSKYVSSSS